MQRLSLVILAVAVASSVAWASTEGVFTKPASANLGSASLHRTGFEASSVTGNVTTFDSWIFWGKRPSIRSKEQRLADLKAENVWKNRLILQIFPDSWIEPLPHMVQAWLRCWVACSYLYVGVGAVWVYYCYFCFGDRLYPPDHIPPRSAVMEQMKVAFLSMPLYAALPAITEHFIEKGWTLAFPHVSDVGIPAYILFFVMYMTSVEFFVYWQHRLLHDIRVGYNKLHYVHHKYNKEHTLSPFAGLAFHPIDGILQAIPYTWTLFFVPMHQLTHELLLFATGVWTTNIHDCIHYRVDPIMGAGYHTIHHTTYKHNYGHYFTYMDKLFGTLITPEDFEKQRENGESSETD